MPQIEIRPAGNTDWPTLARMEHGYQTNYVWQMERVSEDGRVGASFREIRLPRAMSVEYPHTAQQMLEDWEKKPTFVLKAYLDEQMVGYLRLDPSSSPRTAWITDMVVRPDTRRKGIASGLVLAAQEWAAERRCRRILLEMQSKNFPAICLAIKLGYEFCGYQDQYFANQDTALFFTRFMR
jgi:ribosomal protein S18 acetylase RimI-like enzyme